MIQCTEDEVLPGQDQQIRICSNDWHVQTFVCVRGGAERSDIHHGWLKSVTAGRAVFDNKRRAFSAQQQKKVSDSLHLLAQTFSETFRAIAADPDGTIVVDLQIPDLVFLYQTEDFFFQICKYFRLSEIPEAAAVTCDNNGICARQMPAIVILFIGRSLRSSPESPSVQVRVPLKFQVSSSSIYHNPAHLSSFS